MRSDFDPALRLWQDAGRWLLGIDSGWKEESSGILVTSDLLGKAVIPGQAFVQPDASPYRLDRDYLGVSRGKQHPRPGPIEAPAGGVSAIQVWPLARPQ